VFATRAGAGIVSSLQYSLRVQELFLGIFAVTVGTVILPDLSSFAKNARWQEFSSLLEKAIRIIALITIPVTFFSLVMGENIIIFLYKSKRFTDESVALTTRVFYFHIAGLFFIALNRVLSPAFYAQGDTKSPTLAGVIGFAVNIVLSACLVRRFAGSGIAFALSAASVVNTACLLVFLFRRNILKTLPVLSVIVGVGKVTLFSGLAAAALSFLKPILVAAFVTYNRFIAQGIPLTAGALVFFGIIAALLFVTKGKSATLLGR
jgi:putative peptidoglycan lipid II flippase